MEYLTVESLIVHKSTRRKGSRPDRTYVPRIDLELGKLKRYRGPKLKKGEIPLQTWLDSHKSKTKL